jgi:hypothetical protein
VMSHDKNKWNIIEVQLFFYKLDQR